MVSERPSWICTSVSSGCSTLIPQMLAGRLSDEQADDISRLLTAVRLLSELRCTRLCLTAVRLLANDSRKSLIKLSILLLLALLAVVQQQGIQRKGSAKDSMQRNGNVSTFVQTQPHV